MSALAPRREGDGPAVAPGYRTEPADLVADRARILGLWESGLNRAWSPEAKLDWYYGRNPAGLPHVRFLLWADKAVGAASAVPRRMQLGSREMAAAGLVDFVVEPAHRSFFPALALQRGARQGALARFDVLYGLPNAKAAAVMARAGYRYGGDMVRAVRVLRARGYLSRYLPAWIATPAAAAIDRLQLARGAICAAGHGRLGVEWLAAPDARFDDLWRRAAPPDVLAGVRNRAFLAWRFVECPRRPFEFIAVTSEPARRLAAYATVLARPDTLEVCDFLVDEAVPGAGARLWSALARDARRRGHASLSVQFLGPRRIRRMLESAGFVARESTPLFAAFREGVEPVLDPERWYLTRADEDTPGRRSP